ncbi:MAG: glycosyltransferase family 4 protein [bacterium]|nr:glycosyltransferase family 4 protein [bacterium]
MRIAFVGQKGIPATFGGVEKHVEELATRLSKRGHEVTVYSQSHYTKVSGSYKGVRVVRVPTLKQKNLEMITYTFLSLVHLLFSHRKADIVHFQSVDPAILMGLAKLKAKVVVTSHGQAYQRSGKWGKLAKAFSKLAERIFIHFPDKRIAVSKILKNYYESKYHREVVYIPNGVNIPAINSSKEIEKFNLMRDGYILYVGRLIPTKGCHLLIDAYKSINTNKKLVIVGGSSYSNKYIKKLKESVAGNSNIYFLGYQYGKVLQELFANCSLFVLPSEYEGLPVTLLEAMSFAKPVIFSNIPENLGIAEGCGVSFINKNKEDLATKILFLLKNQKISKDLGKRAIERVVRDYNWDTVVAQTENVYQSLIAIRKYN